MQNRSWISSSASLSTGRAASQVHQVNLSDVSYTTDQFTCRPHKSSKQVKSGVQKLWLRSSCIQDPERTDGRFMFSREERVFVLLQNTPEITELTPGWSQCPKHIRPQQHLNSAWTQRWLKTVVGTGETWLQAQITSTYTGFRGAVSLWPNTVWSVLRGFCQVLALTEKHSCPVADRSWKLCSYWMIFRLYNL